jgi:mono/diheme cytochrome c family protein
MRASDARRLGLVAVSMAAALTLAACGGKTDGGGGDVEATLALGQRVYAGQCALCHGHDGRGITGLNPPLTESERLAGSPRELARLLLVGSSALPPTEQATYSNVMPPYPFLSDEEIAAVLTYARGEFASRDLAPVAPATVGEARR